VAHSRIFLVFTLLLALATPAIAQDCECCYCTPYLTGDWCGNRDYLACRGITFDWDVAHFYQGVTSGGLRNQPRYGGHGDYVTTVDFGKLGIQEGLFLKVRAEHNFGQNINGDTGAFIPAAVLADLPFPDEDELILTNVLFTQFLNERVAVFFGKLDTLDGDLNAYAHGRGKTQFSNLGYVVNPIVLRTIPYSTLGCGFTVLGSEGTPVFTYTILNPTETIKTSGFDELFNDGVAMAAELRLPTTFLDMPGHQLFGASWNSRDYVSLDQDPRIVLPNVPINETSGTWSVYWNFDQALVVDRCNPARHWGVFGRAGIGDDEANPIASFLSFGIGGSSPIQNRPSDTFGIGWYRSETSDEISPLIEAFTGPLVDGQGVELFYNIEVTKWLNVTPDLQFIIPARDNIDTAVALGLRAVMTL
jgi:porin